MHDPLRTAGHADAQLMGCKQGSSGLRDLADRDDARQAIEQLTDCDRPVFTTFIPFIADSCGGLHDDSFLLVGRMADAAQQHMAMWRKEQIVRHVLSNVAVAIQRENAATVLAGHAAIDFSRRGPEESNHEGASDEDDNDEEDEEDTEQEEDEEQEEDGDERRGEEEDEEKQDGQQYTA
jgi:hypothetical protein